MALAHELQISAGAVFPLLRTCIVSEQGATDANIRSSLQTITSAEGEWLAQGARGVPENRRNCLDKTAMFFCSDWARPVAMWLGVPVLLVADTGDFDSHTCQVCTKQGAVRVHAHGRLHGPFPRPTRGTPLCSRRGTAPSCSSSQRPRRTALGTSTPPPGSPQLAAAMGSKAAMAPAPAPRRARTRSARSTSRAS